MSAKICPRCGNTFTCDIEAGKQTCWCFDLPNIVPLENIGVDDSTSEGCLCPQCLQERINALSAKEQSIQKNQD